jgi:polysaccharide export outer membrane protein
LAHSLPAVGNGQDDYPVLTIGPGDLISVAVYGDNEFPLQFQVDAQGLIVFPYAGKVKLAGLTPLKAAEKIAAVTGKPNNISVMVLESNSFSVNVLGYVSRPGKFQIRGVPSVLTVLAEAGGGLPGADLGGARLIQGGRSTKIDLNRFLEGSLGSSQAPLLYPGDTLVVPKGGFPSTPGDFALLAGVLASLAVAIHQLTQADILNF